MINQRKAGFPFNYGSGHKIWPTLLCGVYEKSFLTSVFFFENIVPRLIFGVTLKTSVNSTMPFQNQTKWSALYPYPCLI